MLGLGSDGVTGSTIAAKPPPPTAGELTSAGDRPSAPPQTMQAPENENLASDNTMPGADGRDPGSGRTRRPPALQRLARLLSKQPGWLVAVLLAGGFAQVEAHLFNPLIHGVASLYDDITGHHPLGSPAAQLDAIAGRAQQQGFTVSSTSVGFAFGPKADVMILAPRDPTSSSRSAQMRVYAIPSSGRVRLLFDFRPAPVAAKATRASETPLDWVFVPRTFGLRVRSVARFNGSPGVQVLVDVYDPREPAIEVLPLLLSQNLSSDRFVLVPLLSPTTTGRASMAGLLTRRYLRTGGWGDEARRMLYDRPIAIRNAAKPGVVLRSFAVSGYGISTAAPFGTNGGVLTLAAGYAVRGGDFPTPTMMQVLVWHIDLTASPATAKTFNGVPDFAPLSPSAPANQIQRALNRVAQGLPPSPSPDVQ